MVDEWLDLTGRILKLDSGEEVELLLMVGKHREDVVYVGRNVGRSDGVWVIFIPRYGIDVIKRSEESGVFNEVVMFYGVFLPLEFIAKVFSEGGVDVH
jgi:hypothetical protein